MALSERITGSAPLRVMFRSQFGMYLSGNTLSLVGTWMQRIACSWLVWDWTQSALWVGILAASDLLPVVAISPFAGVAADRWDRRKLNVIAQAYSALNAILLAVLLAVDGLGLGLILGLTFVQGTLTAVTQPSRFAMVQQMVSREDVGAAVGLNSACVNVARLLGPAAAGAMILHLDIVWVFVVNALSTVVFIGVLLRLRLTPVKRKSGPAPFLTEMREGFAYVLQTAPVRLVLLGMFAGGALVRGVMELLPAVAAQALGPEVTGLAILTGSSAIGAVVSGISMGRNDVGKLLRVAPIWWGLGGLSSVALTQATSPWFAMLSAVALGGSITRGLVSTQTFIQLTTPDYLRGRALSVFGLAARGSPALGALGIGYAVDAIGLGPSVLVASGLLFVLLLGLAAPINAVAGSVQEAP